MAHQLWTPPTGSSPAAPCVNYVTLSALQAAILSNAITPGCWYVVQGVTQGTLGTFDVAVLGTANNAVSTDCHVLTIWDTEWWDGTFDASTGLLRSVRDNDGNFVVGDITISTFPWANGWSNVTAEYSSFAVSTGWIASYCNFWGAQLFDDGQTANIVNMFACAINASVVSINRSVNGVHTLSGLEMWSSSAYFDNCSYVDFTSVRYRGSFSVATSCDSLNVGYSEIGENSVLALDDIDLSLFDGVFLSASSLNMTAIGGSVPLSVQRANFRNSSMTWNGASQLYMSDVDVANSAFFFTNSGSISFTTSTADNATLNCFQFNAINITGSSFESSSFQMLPGSNSTSVESRLSNTTMTNGGTYVATNSTISDSNIYLTGELSLNSSQIEASVFTITAGTPGANVTFTQSVVSSTTFNDDSGNSRLFTQSIFGSADVTLQGVTGVFSVDRSHWTGLLQLSFDDGQWNISNLTGEGQINISSTTANAFNINNSRIDGDVFISGVTGPSSDFDILSTNVAPSGTIIHAASGDFSARWDSCSVRSRGMIFTTALVSPFLADSFEVAQGQVTATGGSNVNIIKMRSGVLNIGAFGHGDVYHNVGAADTLTAPNFGTSRDDFNNSLI